MLHFATTILFLFNILHFACANNIAPDETKIEFKEYVLHYEPIHTNDDIELADEWDIEDYVDFNTPNEESLMGLESFLASHPGASVTLVSYAYNLDKQWHLERLTIMRNLLIERYNIDRTNIKLDVIHGAEGDNMIKVLVPITLS